MTTSRQDLIDISERYFHGCNDHEWQVVMDTFAPDCLMWFPAATFVYRGHEALGMHFKDFLGTFKVIHFHDFSHVADPVSRSICTYFTVRLEEEDGQSIAMKNCNIFRLDDAGKFREIIIYNSGKLDAGFHAGSEQ
ncbi:MAG: nuclear transport factor 2 family protein [Gammaproteobacteria bacterium]